MSYFTNSIFYLSLFSSLTVGLYGVKVNRDKKLRPLTVLLFLSFICDLPPFIYFISLSFTGQGLYIPYTGVIYRLLELLTLAFFYISISKVRNVKIIVFLVAFLSALYFLLFHIDFSSNYIVATPIRISNSVLFIILSLLFFRDTFIKMRDIDLPQWSMFHAQSALLLYFSGVFFFFALFRPIASIHASYATLVWAFHNLFIIVRNILFAIAFKKSNRYG